MQMTKRTHYPPSSCNSDSAHQAFDILDTVDHHSNRVHKQPNLYIHASSIVVDMATSEFAKDLDSDLAKRASYTKP